MTTREAPAVLDDMDAPAHLPVFVYGTLRPGQGNHEYLLQGETSNEQSAVMPGLAMYVGPGFPYCAVTDDPSDHVIGEVITIKDGVYDRVLRSLDHLEGFHPGASYNHYDRQEHTAVLADGTEVTALVYVVSEHFADRVTSGQRISSGDWLTSPHSRRSGSRRR